MNADLWGDAADRRNVIVFARGRRGAEANLPPLTIGDRPAPPPSRVSICKRLAMVAGSLAVHAALVFALWEPARLLPSVGLETITVELVLGANRPAGLAPILGANEVEVAASSEPASTATVHQAPADQQQPEQPRQEEPPPADEPAPPAPQQAAHTDPDVAANAASSIGRGSSAAEVNYGGLVTAHLARHKQYPVSERANGVRRSGAVKFSIDGRGDVTAASVERSTGATVLDRELVAMVRRASPFPPPPGGRPMSFIMPVNFFLN